MLNLILDTNIYRSDINRKNAAFKTLIPLLKKPVIKLHIPFFVENEFLSFLNSQSEENILAAEKSLNWLVRINYLNEEQRKNLLNEILNNEKIISHLHHSFHRWVKEVFAATYKLEFEDCKKSISAYFEGSPPHVGRRDRDNIPDSFIFQEIAKIRNKYGEVHFVSTDGKFRSVCQSHLTEVTTYQKLDEFVTSTACQLFINVNEGEKQSLTSFISSNKKSITSELTGKVVDLMAGKIINCSKDRHEFDQATIISVYEPDQIDFEIEESVYYGGGIIVVPCSFKCEVLIDASIYKPDYYAMDKFLSVTELNEHYFSAEETIEVLVDGRARFEFDMADIASVELINCDIDSIKDIYPT